MVGTQIVNSNKEGSNEQLKKDPKILTLIIILFVITAMIWASMFYVLVLGPRTDENKRVLSTGSPQIAVFPWEIAHYNFTVYNPNTFSDDFEPEITGLPEEWIEDIPETFTVSGRTKRLGSFTIRPTLHLALNGSYPFVLNLSSVNTDQSYELNLSIIVRQTFGFRMFCYNNTHLAESGRNTYYALGLENSGNGNDEIAFSQFQVPNDWEVSYESNPVIILPFNSSVVIINISTDPETEAGLHGLRVDGLSLGGTLESVWLNTTLTDDIGNDTIKIGDEIRTDYIGIYPDSAIFDTSLSEIAMDDDLPKTEMFHPRPQYSPFKMVVGENDPNVNDEYYLVIEGYWEGVIGLKVHETIIVRLPPEKAYHNGEAMIFEITVVSIDN